MQMMSGQFVETADKNVGLDRPKGVLRVSGNAL